MFGRLKQLFARWFGKSGPERDVGSDPPLRPGEAAHKGRPGEQPPLERGEAAFKGRPGEQPPLEREESAYDGGKVEREEPPTSGSEGER